MSSEEKKIGVLTSGGDAPGMNATIRAIVRTAVHYDIKVIGIKRGYEGLLTGDIIELNRQSVSDTIHKGGTFLLTARCQEMMTADGQDKAANICKILGLDCLIVIGGNGSIQGALELTKRGIPTLSIPGTIDLDLDCTDYTVGFDTAVNTAMEAINKIRDTSYSHERCSVVEVMGRHCGFIALWCALTGGAEEVLIPETGDVNTRTVIQQIFENRSGGKKHNLIVVSEGVGKSAQLAADIESITGIEARATILGHLQRGGSPTAVDRMHACMMGYNAVDLYMQGITNRVIVYRDGKHTHLDLQEALNYKRPFDDTMRKISKILSN